MQSRISIDQLKVGIYIHLDMHWMDHPFSFGSFKIKSEEQIRTLRDLGLQSVRFDPSRSDVPPAAPGPVPAPGVPAPSAPLPRAPDDPALLAKMERQERLRKQRESATRIEKQYLKAATMVRGMQANLQSNPAHCVAEVKNYVEQLTSQFLTDQELTIHAVLSRPGGADTYVHSLNVALLSLMVAREMGTPKEETCLLGQGALYHDIGLRDVPSRILRKTDPLTSAERAAREFHCEAGVRLGQSLGLPDAILDIIAQHHEFSDGTGYPNKRKGDGIAPLARVVAIVNQFDNFCNPVNIANALTPHESLSQIFTQQKTKFDAKVMQVLIRCLGVYPPGSLVMLSNESVCMVTSVNTARPLKPTVVVYDPAAPRELPIILDLLHEPELNISKALRPAQIPPAVLDYLSGRSRVSYFFDTNPA